MLAATTTTGTWIALATLVVMLVPIYILTLNASKSYGRLETKVDSTVEALARREPVLSSLNAETIRQSTKLDVISQSMIAQTSALAVLTSAFQAHQLQDADSFATLKASLPDPAIIVTAAAEAAAKVLLTARQATIAP